MVTNFFAKMKTLIIFTPGFPADDNDVNCLPYFQSFVRAINRIFPGLKISVIAFKYPNRKGAYNWLGNEVVAVGGGGAKWLRIFSWIRASKQVKKIVRNGQCIGILSFWCLEEAWLGRRIARRHSLPLKIWICGQDAKKENKWVRLINPNAKELVANSDFIVNEFSKNHRISPALVVPNSIEPGDFALRNHERTIDLLGVGSLIPLKRFDLFLTIASTLISEIGPLRIVICGNGPEKDLLRKKIQQLHLHEYVVLKSEVPHPDVFDIMQRSKILLHPSLFEGYSTVCLEALYAGCKVVSFIGAESNPVEGWYVVDDTKEMIITIRKLLTTEQAYQSNLLHTAEGSARKMISSFLNSVDQ